MNVGLVSVITRNLVGNVLVGLACLALGITSLAANAPSRHEREDEMSRFHSGRASSLALWTTLTAVALVCAIGIVTQATIDLAASCYLVTGFALAAYGAAFAALEGGTLPC